MHIKFGKEVLYLEGWCARTQYSACCRLLGPGINIHLAENELLREIFHLGNRVLPLSSSQKTSKLEKVFLFSLYVNTSRSIKTNFNSECNKYLYTLQIFNLE